MINNQPKCLYSYKPNDYVKNERYIKIPLRFFNFAYGIAEHIIRIFRSNRQISTILDEFYKKIFLIFCKKYLTACFLSDRIVNENGYTKIN